MTAVATAGPLVLVVEDELPMRRFLRATLTSQGYRVVESTTGADALVQAKTRLPDLVLLDLGLPDFDGLDVIRQLRAWTASMPIVVVSARGLERDKIAVLDDGADDYLTKPFAAGELLARLRVALRHARRATEEAAEAIGDARGLRVDVGGHRVFVEGREVHLTPIEFKLLAALVRNADRVVTHRQLLLEVWGPAHEKQTHYVRVYMATLRRKIELEPARPRFLVTEPGIGYRLRFRRGDVR